MSKQVSVFQAQTLYSPNLSQFIVIHSVMSIFMTFFDWI